MLISYHWLRELTGTTLSPEELRERLTMVGLAIDAVEANNGDFVLDVEVPSNRPDCLSHIGIAREVAVIELGSLRFPKTKSAKVAGKAAPKPAHRANSARRGPRTRVATKPALLAGGNPQIAKADGDAPVQAYIAAMPGWKRDVGRRLDALIARTVPNVRKAVRWNSPFYGIEGQGWFLNFHCFTKYVRVAFFRGTSLRPLPPGESKIKDTRYLDIHEDDHLDEDLVASWIRQASELPGWVP